MPTTAGDPLGGAEQPANQPLAGPPSILADMIDQNTLDFASIFEGRDPVDAQMLEAIMRVRGSGAAVLDEGHRFMDVTHLSDDASELIKAEARRCTRRLVDRGDVLILSMTVAIFEGENAAELTIVYQNLRSSDPEPRTIRKRLPEAARG